MDFLVYNANPAGVIQLETTGDWKMYIIGTSCESTAPACKSITWSRSALLRTTRNQDAIIALLVGSGQGITHEFILSISWPNDCEVPKMDLRNRWMPKDETRIGAINGAGLEVRIGGITFCTAYDRGSNHPGKYVSGDLLCQYLIGMIPAADLIEAAGLSDSEHQQVAHAFRQKTEHAQLLQDVQSHLSMIKRLDAARDEYVHKYTGLKVVAESAEIMLREWLSDFDITSDGDLAQLILEFHEAASKRINNREMALNSLGRTIERLSQVMKMGWANPWRLTLLPDAARQVVDMARAHEVLPPEPKQ